MTSDDRNPAPAAHAAPSNAGESSAKPSWTRPEITSFKPVSDTQAVSYRIGDGISNLS